MLVQARTGMVSWAVVVLFFGSWQVVKAQSNNASQMQVDELRLVSEQLRSENAKLKAQLNACQAEVAQFQEGTKAARDEMPGTLSAAKVLAINNPLQVVVLNVGAEQGVRVGMPFQVWRADRMLAEVRVVEVRPRICGALVEQVEKGATLVAGDTASVAKTEKAVEK